MNKQATKMVIYFYFFILRKWIQFFICFSIDDIRVVHNFFFYFILFSQNIMNDSIL